MAFFFHFYMDNHGVWPYNPRRRLPSGAVGMLLVSYVSQT